MKTRYLSNKIQHAEYIDASFPVDLNLKDLLMFFKQRKFKESKYSKKMGTTQNGHFYCSEDLWAEISESNVPMFCLSNTNKTDKYSFWVRFANPGKVSEDNPVYFCRYNLKDWNNPKISEMVTIEKKYSTACPYDSFEEFAEDMNNKF